MTERNEKWWAQPHAEHRLKGTKEDRDSLLLWYLKIELIRHQVTELNAKVLSRAMYQVATQEGTFPTQTQRWLWKDKSVCQPVHLPALFLVGLFPRRRSTAVSVTGFRMCPSISTLGNSRPPTLLTCTTGKIYSYCFLTYQSTIQSLQCMARFSALLLPLLQLLAVLPNAMKYKQFFMIAEKVFFREILHNRPTYFSCAAPF